MKEIREIFWEKVREVDLLLKYLDDHSRHIEGIKFAEEFRKAYEEFKKSLLKIDELLAVYCGHYSEEEWKKWLS